MTDFTLTNARLVLNDEIVAGSVYVRDGRIALVDTGAASVPGAIDCDGDYVMPGLIELHTDNLERHIQPRPRVDWPHTDAILAHDGELASVGITTVFDAMRIGSVVSNEAANYRAYARALSRELLDVRAQNVLRISHFLHLRAEICSETLIDELEEFTPEDRIGLLSIMDHTPGQRQFRDISKLKDYVCGKHGMNDADFAAHVDAQLATRERLGDAHEQAAVDAAGRLGAVLASHDDTTAEQVEVSAGHGVRLAEFPTTVEAAKACHAHGIAVMMGGPNVIRGGSHSGNVAAKDLADADCLDILSSDYVPGSLMTSAFRLADVWGDIPRAIRTVTSTPAEAAKLDDRGRMEPGLHADLVRVRLRNGTPVVRGVWSHGRQVG